MHFNTNGLIVCIGLLLLCRLDNAKDPHHTSNVAGPSVEVNQKQTRGKPGVNSYFEKQELALTRSHWQVIWPKVFYQLLSGTLI